MRPPKSNKIISPELTPSLSPNIAIGLIAWSVMVSCFFYEKSGTQFRSAFDQWLITPFALLPSLTASFRHIKHLSALAAFIFIFIGTGRAILRSAAIQFHNGFEKFTLSFSLGYGAWGTLFLLAGLVGAWSQTVFLSALIAGGVLAGFEAWQLRNQVGGLPLHLLRHLTAFDLLCLGGFLSVWLFFFRFTLVPETFYDALHYHLSLPNLYLLSRRILPTPENSYSGIPALPQMLYGWTLAIDEWGIVAAMLHSSLAICIACGLAALCHRTGRPAASSLAAVSFFITPVVIAESFRTSVGLEWTLMEVCCFICFLAALSIEPINSERRKWLILTGIFLGFGMSTKYPAWLMPISLLPALFFKSPPSEKSDDKTRITRLKLSELLLVLIVATLCVSPWIGKNIFFYRNPIYPFLHEYFQRGAEYMPDWRQLGSAGALASTNLLSLRGVLNLAALPINFLLPLDDIHQSVGLFCACFFPLLFFVRLSPGERLLGWFCLGAWIPLCLMSSENRFFIPHLALLTTLLCCVIARTTPQWARISLLILSCLFWSATGLELMTTISSKERNDTLIGQTSYGEYLGHARTSYPTPPYAGIEYVNQAAPAGARVLMYGDGRSFYLRRPHIAASSDQIPVLEVWANESSNAELLKKRVDSEGIRYIVINLGEVARLRTSLHTTSQGRISLSEFWKRYTSREFGVQDRLDRWVGVYKVLNTTEASMPHSTDDLFSHSASQSNK